jgi:hypothetical protein
MATTSGGSGREQSNFLFGLGPGAESDGKDGKNTPEKFNGKAGGWGPSPVFRQGDINSFFALLFDNLSTLIGVVGAAASMPFIVGDGGADTRCQMSFSIVHGQPGFSTLEAREWTR